MPKRSNDRSSQPGAAEPGGMRKGLTSYGDQDFSLFLRKAFIKGAGYSDAALDRPVIGIADTGSIQCAFRNVIKTFIHNFEFEIGLRIPYPFIVILACYGQADKKQ